jgi:hypothetical protein
VKIAGLNLPKKMLDKIEKLRYIDFRSRLKGETMKETKYFLEDCKTPMPEDGGKGYRVDVGYNKGGMNYFNSTQDRRGYYLYISKVNREKTEFNCIESTMMFTGGLKRFLLEVKRQSPKALDKAVEMAESLIPELMAVVKEKCSEVESC